MSDKMFTVAGYATNADGTVKVRFANDLVARIKILNKAGCTDINLIELPKPMNKVDALQHLQEQGIQGDAGYVVSTKLAEKQKLAAKSGKTATLSTGKSVKVKARGAKTVDTAQAMAAVKAASV